MQDVHYGRKGGRVRSNFGIDPAETIGSGPYIVTDWKVNESITLVEERELLAEHRHGVSKVILYLVPDASTQSLMYQNGQLDILDMDYLDSSIVENTYKTQYADNIVTAHRVGLTYFALNEDNSYLSDVNVRKAIQMSIDRQGIIDEIYGGNAILENGIIPTGVWGHDDTWRRFSTTGGREGPADRIRLHRRRNQF